MLDIRHIRQDPNAFDRGFSRRGLSLKAADLLALDEQNRSIITALQEHQTARNRLAKQIGEAKKAGQSKENVQEFMDEAERLKKEIGDMESQASLLKAQLQEILEGTKNMPADEIPDGADESANVCIRRWGEIPSFSFTPKSHDELGTSLGLMDFDRATKLSGSRFVVLYGALARLERALALFMLDTHTQEFGYKEVSPPLLVNDNAVYGTGQLPRQKEDMFQANTGHWLIPTSEVSLTNLLANEILSEADLPYRFTACTPCFRSEAGAAGRDTRGMIRQHQFTKVELVSVTTPEQSNEEHERMTGAAETILQKLALPYRVMVLSAGDMGFAARKTYDLEVWLPSQDTYREISSCSQCGDFQARRMNMRFRPESTAENQKPNLEFVHTLNGSGLAVGRTLVAVLENYQQEDGSIKVPEVLQPYMNGLKIIQLTPS